MNRKILFSPVGGTDPISNYHDGSMLHICRKYKPDRVYLFLSKEIYEYHERDNRYLQCLEMLGELLDHKFEHELIIRKDLVDVQNFDIFYEIFRKEIGKIEKDMDETDHLYVNISSGTPAMKTALLVMATFAEFRFTPLQVATPTKKSNILRGNKNDYEIMAQWEQNRDNRDGFEDRCTVEKIPNLVYLMKVDMLKSLVKQYDYHAAYTLASDMREKLNEKGFLLIKAASERCSLDLSAAENTAGKIAYDLFPVKNERKRKSFEYALLLDLKRKRQEYADFIRGTTPLIVALLEEIVEKDCGIRIMEYCEESGGIKKWKPNKIEHNLRLKRALEQNQGKRKLQEGPVYSWHLNKIIQEFSENRNLKTEVRTITNIERKVRNTAAHTIVKLTDHDIKESTGMTSEQIYEKIQYLVREAGIFASEQDWKSYEILNNAIIEDLGSYEQ